MKTHVNVVEIVNVIKKNKMDLSKKLLASESLAVSIVQSDNENIYRTGIVTNISSTYSTGSGTAAIISTSLASSGGSLVAGKQYSILINVKGDVAE